MKPQEFKNEVLVLLDQPDTEFLYNKAENTNDVALLKIYLKRAKRIWAVNISDADQLLIKTIEP